MGLHEGTYRFEIHDLLANDQHGVLMVEEEWQKPKPFRNRSVHIWHFQGGRATEFWFFNEDQAGVDASFQAGRGGSANRRWMGVGGWTRTATGGF
jgi:hypothetical protein